MDVRLENVVVRVPTQGGERTLFTVPKLSIQKGERVLIRGPSGRGKTTLLHLIAGLFLASEGRVLLDGRDLKSLSEAERTTLRRTKLSLVFQKLNLIPHLTALENVELAPREDRTTALRSLNEVHLGDHASTLAANLSLGEQQRVAVARVLAARPELVLADEPTSSLDDANAEAVSRSLLGLSRESTVIVVSHDHRLDARFSRVIDFDEFSTSREKRP